MNVYSIVLLYWSTSYSWYLLNPDGSVGSLTYAKNFTPYFLSGVSPGIVTWLANCSIENSCISGAVPSSIFLISTSILPFILEAAASIILALIVASVNKPVIAIWPSLSNTEIPGMIVSNFSFCYIEYHS